MTKNGSVLNIYSSVKKVTLVSKLKIIASFSIAFSGLLEAVRPCVTYPSVTVTGTPFINASTGGPRKLFGNIFFKPFKSLILQQLRCINIQLDKKSNAEIEALGCSRGGFTTILHAALDALGNPLYFKLTQRQRSDFIQAEALLNPYLPAAVIADKGYDSEAIVSLIQQKGAKVVILVNQRRSKNRHRHSDRNLYKDRNKN